MATLWQQVLAAHWAEHVALLCGVGYALLVVRRNRWAWCFGAASSAVLVWLAAGARLPLQAALQGVYVLMAGYGFWRWSRAARENTVVPVGIWQPSRHLVALGVIVAVGFGVGAVLESYTSAAWPRLDAAVTAMSLLATWMTARALLENWLYWLAVDAISFYLYFSQGLIFVALLYVVYFVIAIFGLRSWWQHRP